MEIGKDCRVPTLIVVSYFPGAKPTCSNTVSVTVVSSCPEQFVATGVAYPNRLVPASTGHRHLVFGAIVAESFSTATAVMLFEVKSFKVGGTSLAVLRKTIKVIMISVTSALLKDCLQ